MIARSSASDIFAGKKGWTNKLASGSCTARIATAVKVWAAGVQVDRSLGLEMPAEEEWTTVDRSSTSKAFQRHQEWAFIKLSNDKAAYAWSVMEEWVLVGLAKGDVAYIRSMIEEWEPKRLANGKIAYVHSTMKELVPKRLIDTNVAYIYSVVEKWAAGELVNGCSINGISTTKEWDPIGLAIGRLVDGHSDVSDHSDDTSGKGKRQTGQKVLEDKVHFLFTFYREDDGGRLDRKCRGRIDHCTSWDTHGDHYQLSLAIWSYKA